MDNGNPTICGLRTYPHFVNGSGMPEQEYPYIEIGYRLEALRKGFSDLSQKAWAEKHNFNPTQYNNWAKGSRRITVDAAELLCDRYGLTLDAIYRGRLDGVSEKARNIL